MTKLNKRILSALLAVVLLLTNFPVVSAASDGFAIHYEGMAVAEVEFYEHERITVSAEGNPGSGYQWQIKIPGTEQWVNIQGQTGQTIQLSKAVVGSLMVGGSAHVRCAAISDGQEIDHTAALCTTVKKEEYAPQISTPPVTAESAAKPAPAPAEPPAEETEAPVEATEVPVESIPEATEAPAEVTDVPTEPAVENEPAPEVVEPSEVPVETTEIPEEIVEIPAETAASTEPEAEVVVAAPAEDSAEPAEAPTEEPAAVPEIPAETAAPVEMETEVVVTAPAENSAKPAEAPTEEPAAVPEIPAETAASTEPEAEVVATVPAEEPVTAPVEEEPAETFVDKVVKFFAPRAAADESSDIEIVTVTVHYRAVDRENKFEKTQMDAGLKENAATAEPVTDPYVAHIVSGSDLEMTVPCHVMPGYTLTVPDFHKDDPIIVSSNNLVLNLSGVTEDQTFYIYYVESKVSYTARYFMQNVYNDLYTERTDILTTEIQNKMVGYPNAEPDPEIIYPDIYGFTALFFQPDTIAADGSTVFEVYYDRNYYLMNFDMDGGYGTAPVYARYGTAFTVSPPTKPGNTFAGWTLTDRDINTDGSDQVDTEYVTALEACLNDIEKVNGRVTGIPFSNLNYTANWNEEKTSYTVAYWIQGSNDKTFIGSRTDYEYSGKKVSGEDDIQSVGVCGQEEHTHNSTCLSCALTEHTHHTEHERSCYSYVSEWGAEVDGTSSDQAVINNANTNHNDTTGIYIYVIWTSSNGALWPKILINGKYYTVNIDGSQTISQAKLDSITNDGVLAEGSYNDYYGTTYYARKYALKPDCKMTICGNDCTIETHMHTDKCYSCGISEHTHNGCVSDYAHHVTFMPDATDKDVEVKGDGSTVVNVYYQRKEYTLKFYYAMTSGSGENTKYYVVGGSTYGFGNDASSSIDRNDEKALLSQYLGSGGWNSETGLATEMPQLNDTGKARQYTVGHDEQTVDDVDYKFHYISFKARYGDDISDWWPCGVFESVTMADGNTAWDKSDEAFVSAWNGEYNVAYSKKSNQTIKGKYEKLDSLLLWENGSPADDTIAFLCFWENGANLVTNKWNKPGLFRYNIYMEVLPNQDLTNETTVTRAKLDEKGQPVQDQNGNPVNITFYLYDSYDTCDDSDPGQQTQPNLQGYSQYTYPKGYDSNYQYWVIQNSDPVKYFEYREIDYDADLYTKGYELNFYYARTSHTLVYWNHDDYLTDGMGVSITYGTPLKKYGDYVNADYMHGIGDDPYTHQPNKSHYPDTLEPNAYYFDDWYTTAGFLEGTAMNWDTTMPDADVKVYARWLPVQYDSYFYLDYEYYRDRLDENGELDRDKVYVAIEDTNHGEAMNLEGKREQILYPKHPSGKTTYKFVNWFYIDTDGTKKAFNPSEMAVRKELHLFAEWTSSSVREYTVSYQYGVQDPITGEYGPVSPAFTMAENSKGYALEATTKTFTALPREKLDNYPSQNDGYPNLDLDTSDQLWLPHTNSHSIVMREDNEDNVFTFYYVTKENVTYTVKYLDAATQEPVMPEESITISEAVVTVPFKYKAGYIPDAFHKRLVLSANDEENVVIFYYTKDENASGGETGDGVSSQRYLVMHHYPAIEGDPNSEDIVQEYDYIDQVGKLVTATQESQNGFAFDEAKTKEEYEKWFGTDADQYVKQVDGKWTVSGVVTSGKDNGANKPLVLNLYYRRENYSYKVQYIDWETKVPIQDDKMVYDIPFGKTVSENSIEITGYDLYGADESGKKTLDLTISWDKDKNVITFEYIKKKVTIKYVPICTEPGLTGGFGGVSNPIDYDKTTPFGSIAFAASGFHFKGWYSDEEGNTQVAKDVRFQPQVDLSTGIYDYTYYALFEPITLTIYQQDMAENDSAVYEVLQGTTVVARVMLTGTNSVTLMAIPAGNYTVKEVSGNWTWTYNDPDPVRNTVEVVAGQENDVTFNYADRHVGSCWLHNETRRQP